MVLYIFLIDGAFFFVAFFDASATNVLLGNKKAGERLAANNENASNAVNIFFSYFTSFLQTRMYPVWLYFYYIIVYFCYKNLSVWIYIYINS